MKKRGAAAICAAVLAAAAAAGYLYIHALSKDNKITVKSDFLSEADANTLERMKKKYPHISFEKENITHNKNILGEEILTGTQGFIETIPFTDTGKYAKLGCAADITDMMKKYHYDEMIAPEYLEVVESGGRYYGIPKWTYHMGIIYSRELFEEAGLTDEDGYPIYPDTYDELAQTASLIKQRTGKAGFFFPNTYGQGGWAFMNLAWSNGVEFTKEENGEIVSAFNTPECVETMQYVKDLKWKYDALPETNFGDSADFQKMFADGNVAMGFFASSEINENMENMPNGLQKVAFSKIPEGNTGRYSLRGGTILMFRHGASEEELNAAFLWIIESGFCDASDTDARKKLLAVAKRKLSHEMLVGYADDSVFKSSDYYNLRKELEEENSNIDYNIIKNFSEADDVEYRMEIKYYPQELYRILDTVIQTVVTDENADCAALIAEASEKYNNEYLKKYNENNAAKG